MSDKVKGKHEYVDLEVDELSVVDKAANLKEFAVIKCQTTQEGDAMSQEKEVKKEEEKVVEVEVKDEETSTEEPQNSSVRKAFVNIESLVEKVVKSLEKDEEPKPDDEKEVKKKEDDKESDKEEPEVKTEKAEGDDEKEEKPEVDEEVETAKMLDQLLTSIQKAKSLTPSRVETLKKVNELLTTFFNEVEPKKEEVSKSVEDKADDKPDFSEVKKAVESKLDEVLETMKSLNERIDEIEKTRAPSASIDEEGDTETIEKSHDDIWSGLPIG